ncbi:MULTISPECIES: hypothetical protein [Thioalkalivibrio]|uniref:hypothetical protein n=1 Tax=Thioalkalivibrio TaxID=106633 RepID=UPI00036B7F5C|nr:MULTISPECIES: hypothetical protein [Thioalkalivibrio]
MSNLQDKLAAGVRSAREDQDKDSNTAADNAPKKDTSATPASTQPHQAASTKAAATKKAATPKGTARKTATRKGSATKRKAPAKKPAAQSTRKTSATKSSGSAASRRGGAPELDPGKAKATADEPWKNLHPNRIWPD